MNKQILDPLAYGQALSLRDLTDAARGAHSMQLLVQECIEALCKSWHCAVVLHRAPPVVSVADNYDELHYPAEGASRDARYTRYVSECTLLRSQTSAMVPAALRMIAGAYYADVLLACLGLTYRRDAIDRLHVGEPHQLDLWRIARRRLDRRDLEEMIDIVATSMLPGVPLRLSRASHPYTVDGLEVHAEVRGSWVEILECGIALPAILDTSGLSVDSHAGLAMGIGLDRMLMLRKGIDDIRLLRSEDPRIACQMLDLEPYRPVSAQPAIIRDLSIAVESSLTIEELGDRVRSSLGEASRSLEEVAVLDAVPYEALPEAARKRLGMSAKQKNVLLRIVIRDLERTLTSDEGNRLRDRVYDAIHEGSVKSWASHAGRDFR